MVRRQLLFAAFILASITQQLQAEEAIQWAPNLPAAVNMASRHNQLVLIHFWAPNCPPCRALEQNVFTRQEVAQAIHRDFVPVKVNASALPDTAKKYGVDRWPMDVIVTPAGYQLHSMVSPQDPREYVQVLYRVAADRQPGRSLTAADTQNPDRAAGWGGAAAAINSPVANQPAANQPAANQPQANPYINQPPASQPAQPRWDDPQAASGAVGGAAASPWGDPQQPQQRYGQPDPRYGSQPSGNQFAQQQGAQGGFSQNDNRPANDPWAAQQPAPYGREYANPYAQDPAGQPGQDQYNQNQPPVGGAAGNWQDPASGGQPGGEHGRYGQDPRQGQDPRRGWENNPPANQTRPRQTVNPYIDEQRGAAADSHPARENPSPQRQPQAGPPLALDGYCPVTLVQSSKWNKGDKRFGIIHRGQLYLFASEAEKQAFWKNPDQYAPIFAGNDPVVFAESGQEILGSRRHGVFFRDQIYLFTNEETLERFWKSPERYAEIAHQAMQRNAGPRR